jgi:hypothetical protein
MRKAKIQARKGNNAQAIVSQYEFDEKNYENLRVVHFPEHRLNGLPLSAPAVVICNITMDTIWLSAKLPMIMWAKQYPLWFRELCDPRMPWQN